MSDFERLPEHDEATMGGGSEADLTGGPVDAVPDETPEGWMQRLGALDFVKEHRTAITVVGAAALAVGAGVYALKRSGRAEQFFIDFADRRAAEQGVISLGERVAGGAAVSLPVSEAALESLETAKSTGTTMKALFAMTGQKPDGEAGDFAYPLTGDRDHIRQHGETARRAAGWLIDHLSRRGTEDKRG
jgi:hypothetical protein